MHDGASTAAYWMLTTSFGSYDVTHHGMNCCQHVSADLAPDFSIESTDAYFVFKVFDIQLKSYVNVGQYHR